MANPTCAYPLFKGRRFRGGNIVPRTTDSGNGNFGVAACYYQLIYDWATNDASDPWTNWIKPQIDAIATVGGNFVRCFHDITVILGDSSHHGAATWKGSITYNQFNATLDQLITYLASKNMYFFGTATDSRPFLDSGINNGTNINTYFANYAATISSNSYSNVIGFDVINEYNAGGNSGNIIADNLGSIIGVAKAARVKNIATTCSCLLGGPSTAPTIATMLATNFPALATAGVEFFDIHVYWYQDPGDLTSVFANSQGLAVTVDEIGVPFTGTFSTANVTGSSLAQRTDYYDRIALMSTSYPMQSVCCWSIAPNFVGNQSNDYGMFDTSFVARTELTSRFSLIPVGMANTFTFDNAAVHLQGKATAISWTSGTIKARLVDGTVIPLITDMVMTGYTGIGTDPTLGSKSVSTDAVNNRTNYFAANALVTSVSAGQTYGCVVVYLDGADDAHRIPLFCQKVTSLTTTGIDLTLTWDSVKGCGYTQNA